MYKVLTIDDESSIRDSFKLALEDDENIQVFEAENGLEGIKQCKAENPDLIFLDLKMPVMNGTKALQEIRQFAPDIPVYIVTAFAKDFFEELQQLRDQGVHFDVAAKPLSLMQIEQITASALQHKG